MSFFLVCAAALALGAATGRWWSTLVTAAAVAALALVFTLSGSGADSPVAFIFVLTEALTAVGILTRRRLDPHVVKA